MYVNVLPSTEHSSGEGLAPSIPLRDC